MMGLTTVVKTAEIPAIVLDRIADCSPQHALFDADEVLIWPAWVLQALLAAGLFQETSRAIEIFCDGCEWGCLKPVIVRTIPNGGKSRAFVACDEEPDQGRVEVAPERLKRYVATVGLAARFISRSLKLKSSATPAPGDSVLVGHVKGRNGDRMLTIEVRRGQLLLTAGEHGVALSELLHWVRSVLAIDDRAVRRLINSKATRSRPEHHLPSQHKQDRRKKAKRDQRIRQEAARLQRQNTKWTVTQIAMNISRMELADGITAARVRRILYDKNN
jgi:hypothetical protein